MSNPLDFSLDLNDVDTSMPVLVAGSYIAVIKEAEILPNKDGDGHNLRVKFATTAPATSTEAQSPDDVQPGYPFTRYYPLQPSKKNADFDFRKGIAELQDAALKCERGNRPPFSVDDLKGKEVVVVIKVRTDTEGPYAGRSSNDVARVRAVPN
jgi:hypothetical protein